MGLVEQIRSALRQLGWSEQQLHARAELPFDVSGLNRRLRGEIRMSTDEVEKLAAAIRLGLPKFRIVYPNRLVAG